jgi:hypothetical protein
MDTSGRLRRKEINVRGKLTFLAGAAVGYVLGSRAGREKYEELVATARKILDSPSVQEAGGVVKAQATQLYGQSKDALSHSKLADKLHNAQETVSSKLSSTAESNGKAPQHMTPNSF